MEPSRTSWPAVFLAVGAGVLGACQIGKAPVALPFIRPELGLDLSQAAWILSIFAVLGSLAGGVMGGFVTRIGARRILPLGLVVLALASLAGSQATGLSWLLSTRVFEGIGYMMVAISAPSLITLLTHPDQRQMAFGLWGAFMPIGMCLSMATAPSLPWLGWRGLWITMAVLLAGCAFLVHRRMPRPAPPPAGPDDHPLRDMIETVKAPGPLILALAFVPYSSAYGAITGFLPTLLIERMGVSPGGAGLLAAAVTAVNILGNLASGPVLRLGWPRRKVMSAASALAGLCCLGAFLPQVPAWGSYGFCIAFSAVGGMLPGCVLGAASLYAPQRRLAPVALGLFMQGSNLGQLMGPALVGAAVAAWGWGAAALILAPALAGGAALSLTLRRAGKEP